MTKRIFIALALLVAAPALVFAQQTQSPLTITVKGVSFNMIRVQGGSFTMGCTSEQGSDCCDDEKPSHTVTLSTYYIGETEVTQELWKAVMGSNPSYYQCDLRPVDRIDWSDCQEFIRRLNELTGKKFRLPTEAEWEFAARGGTKSAGYKYSGSNDIDEVARYLESIKMMAKIHQAGTDEDYEKALEYVIKNYTSVKSGKPNELGIYNMSGSVSEWCSDWYGKYTDGALSNPQGPSSGSRRVFRGGSWGDDAVYCRSSYRGNNCPPRRAHGPIGLRLVLVP